MPQSSLNFRCWAGTFERHEIFDRPHLMLFIIKTKRSQRLLPNRGNVTLPVLGHMPTVQLQVARAAFPESVKNWTVRP